MDEERLHCLALSKAGISMHWDGTRVLDPKRVLSEEGTLDLEPYLASVNKPRASPTKAKKAQ